MMIPARRLLVAGAVLFAIALAAAFEDALEPVWRAAAILVLLAVLGDAAVVWAARMPAASRSAPASLPLGIWHRISLRLTNPGPRSRRVEIFDHTPDAFEVRGMPQRVTVPAGG